MRRDETARVERWVEDDQLYAALKRAATLGGDERGYAVALLARRLDSSPGAIELRLNDISYGEGEL